MQVPYYERLPFGTESANDARLVTAKNHYGQVLRCGRGFCMVAPHDFILPLTSDGDHWIAPTVAN